MDQSEQQGVREHQDTRVMADLVRQILWMSQKSIIMTYSRKKWLTFYRKKITEQIKTYKVSLNLKKKESQYSKHTLNKNGGKFWVYILTSNLSHLASLGVRLLIRKEMKVYNDNCNWVCCTKLNSIPMKWYRSYSLDLESPVSARGWVGNAELTLPFLWSP